MSVNIMLHITLLRICFFVLMSLLKFQVVDMKESKVVNFINENLEGINRQDHKCKTSKIAYLLTLENNEKKLFCSFKFLKENKISKSQKQLMWMLVHDIYKERKIKKKKNFALKQVNAIYKEVHFKRDWYFLGPFQIGKPELDGNPIESLSIENVVSNRWNSKFTAYSELLKSGVVKWTTIQSESNNLLNIQPQVEWNDLVMSLQSMAVTEWQGLVVNEFVVGADETNILVQCLGVNLFYIDNFVVNGDIYHRVEYWYPVTLDAGVHIIKIPVRAKGYASFNCNVKGNSHKGISLHRAKFIPDLVDGNWFSFHFAVTGTNWNPHETIEITNISVKDKDFDDENIHVELVGRTLFQPRQINSVILKIIPTDNRIHTKCKQTSYSLKLNAKFSNGIQKFISLSFRCRTADQSFIFTFIDHDGSVQHAAAIKPLKPCISDLCPVFLTLHGTGVKAENQADSYKRMVKDKFLFGVEKLWLLAPTRHGAHNWEGPGELTAMEALHQLGMLSKNTLWLSKGADTDAVIFAGHSMGGHGAWQVSIHNPDRALAVVSAAGWLSKEDYGESNVLYRHDISISHTDPMVKAIQEACVAENQADKHASNLKGIPVMIRIGADDKTVHPYFSRRMFRLLKENDVNVTYKEFPGKEHWWWDSKSANDGGVTNDAIIRNFVTYVVEKFEDENKKECDAEGCGEGSAFTEKYKEHQESRSYGTFQYVVYNPSSFSGGRGIKILEQKIPLRVSKYTVEIDQSKVGIKTTNIQSLLLYEPNLGPIGWYSKSIVIDGHAMYSLKGKLPWRFCLAADMIFKQCEEPARGLASSERRGAEMYGPARRIAEQPFNILVCDSKNETATNVLKNTAVYLSNLFHLTSDARANIFLSEKISEEELNKKNLIVIGTDSCTERMKFIKLIGFQKNSLKIGDCTHHGNLSALYLATHTTSKLMLLLTGHTAATISDNLILISTPTIPPMTRSPFSNLIPDYVIFSRDVKMKGPGGYLCSGFWNRFWKYDVSSSSCTC